MSFAAPEAENSAAVTELLPSPGAEDDSSTLADLVSMFPSLDHDVAVVVLEAHNGCLEAAVEYLMNTNNSDGATQQTIAGGYQRLSYLDPAHDMVGHFSADIGGLPEVLPRCLYDELPEEGAREEEEGGEEAQLSGSSGSSDPLPQEGTLSWLEMNDPLPTYAEACRDRSAQVHSPPESEEYVEDDHSILNPVEGAGASAGSSSKSKWVAS